MQKIQDYEILEKLGETRGSLVYRGRKEGNRDTVVLKVLKAHSPSTSEIARFKQEYEIIKSIDIEGIIKTYEILSYEGGFVLVLEDFNGVSLKSLLDEGMVFDIKLFLSIGIKISGALGELHNRNIIHKDIKPSNILINQKHDIVKISDFGISSVLTHENEIYNPDIVQGTLLYISPEQTGRMNRTVDYRADLYSLGVTFYKMVTGAMPFESKDPLEIIYSHIAREPVPPVERKDNIPRIISDIIMKLMSKNAEERYQNAFGLMADLEECLERFNFDGRLESFELGREDISSRFIIPQKLFGREDEIEILMSAFERISGIGNDIKEGCIEMMFVTGSPGIGKSALINEISKPVAERGGYFLSGKYEQFRSDTPYSAIIQGFQKLLRQILSESDEKMKIIKENILEALRPNGRIITDIIPELELIIGEQGDVPELAPNEAKNRFNIVFERFVGIFTKKEHPIVLFLDDMQWVDFASLQLIRNLTISPNIKYLLIIGSYRDNEVSESDPLIETLKEIEEAGIRINRIVLRELNKDSIKDLVINLLKCSEQNGLLLAELIYRKTGGNPFFVKEFLHALYNEKLIMSDANLGWKWDIEKIKQMSITDNVVELLSYKINRLPADIQEALRICACIGNRFDLEILAFLLDKSIEDTLVILTKAMDDGFVSMRGDIYVFNHDRIQELAYSLIPDEEKPGVHYKIGKLSLERTEASDLQNKLFYITDQLNLGSSLIADAKEREELARLNLESGVKAKRSAAFLPALRYFEIGISLLEKECWENQYDLTLSIYTEAAEAAFLKADYDAMNRYVSIVIDNARSIYDSIPVYEIKMDAYNAQLNLKGGIEIALDVLKKLNYPMPAKPSKLQNKLALIKIKPFLSVKRIDSLIDLPEITDPHILAILRILCYLEKTAFYVSYDLFTFTVFKSTELSIKYGHDQTNPYHYIAMANMLTDFIGDIEAGYKLGNLVFKLGKNLVAREYESRALCIYYFNISPWKEHLKLIRPEIIKAYHIGMETGEIEWISFSLYLQDLYGIILGVELVELEQQMSKNNKVIEQFKQIHILDMQSILWQIALTLLGRSESPVELTGTAFNEKEKISSWEASNTRPMLGIYYIYRLMLRYIFYNYNYAIVDSDTSIEYLDSLTYVNLRDYTFYSSLVRLALYPEVSRRKKWGYKRFVRQSLKKFGKWVKHAPMNNEHRIHIIKAEEARVLGDYSHAEALYDRAIELSKKNEYLIEEAIANELAGKYYLSRGRNKLAKVYMLDAYSCYSRWGASAKLKHLQQAYPELLLSVSKASVPVSDTSSDSTTSGSASQIIDLTSVIKASQAISGEVVLGKLLEKMMKIVMENAGAQKGFMVLENKGRYIVEAEGRVNSEEIEVLNSIPIDIHKGLSESIVNYVARTNEMLILNDASSEGDFTNDPYVQKNKPKSILCAPIINQGRLLGIIYLENNLSTGAFTQERLEVLNILSSQMAISIENAKFYENLEEKVRERTMELKESEKRFKDVAFSSADWIWEVDNKGVYTYCSEKVEDILGYKPDEIIGKSSYDSMLKEEVKKFREIYAQISKNKEPIKDIENWHLAKNGKRICLLTNGIPILDEQGNFLGYRGIDKDITERKQLEDDLRNSEEQYRMLANNMNDVVSISDLNGKLIYISPSIQRRTGYTSVEWMNMELEESHPKESADLILEKVIKIVESAKSGIKGMGERCEVVTRHKDGTAIHVEIIFGGMYNSKGELVGIQGVSRDITERKALEEALLKSEEQYRLLAENTIDIIWLIDLPTGEKIGKPIRKYISPSIKRITGYTPEEWVRTPVEKTHTPESANLLQQKTNDLIDSLKRGDKMVERLELTTICKDQSTIETELIMSGAYNSKGELVGIQGVTRDITERKQAEMRLKELMKELSRSNKELEEFAYIASHDLQEPLRKVITFGNRLKENNEEKLDKKSTDYIERIQNAAKRMQDLIQGLLNYSRVTTKTQPFKQVDLNKIVNDVVSDLDISIREKGGKIEIGQLPVINADALQMGQLFQNLISNALKFHKPGEPPVVKIRASREAPSESCQILVEDNGIGIDEKDYDKIFGVFQRLHARAEYEGSGIGLAVCKKIVERHGGTIGVESKLGKRTKFVINLPVN